jgi:rod shape-determining protein MreC
LPASEPIFTRLTKGYRQPVPTMKNLFLFLWKNNFTIVFLLLQVFCFYLIIQNNKYQSTRWYHSSNQVTGEIMSAVSSVTQYLNLKNSNRDLAAENARLKSMLSALTEDTVPVYQNRDTTGKYVFHAARVVNNSFIRRNNYITIDIGAQEGIRPEMGVIGPNGIVGQVQHVSDHYATVISLLHKNSRISAGFKNSRYFGSLSWPGMNPREALLSDIARHVKFAVGDTIVTTAYSALFPEGIMVGTVKDFEARDGSSFYQITITLSTDFTNLHYVYVVENKHQQEIKDLESQSQNNDH